MNWIEKTLEEYDEVLGKAPVDEVDTIIKDFLRKKFLESYKNGAFAERRSASPQGQSRVDKELETPAN